MPSPSWSSLSSDTCSVSQHQFGLWSAIAIHDTSSVVGAAPAYGNEALEVATTVKLARALWIIPVSLLSAFLFKNKGKKISIPWFILFFILAMLANSYLPGISTVAPAITAVWKSALVVTLFLIGAGLSVEKVKSRWLETAAILGIILRITVFCILSAARHSHALFRVMDMETFYSALLRLSRAD